MENIRNLKEIFYLASEPGGEVLREIESYFNVIKTEKQIDNITSDYLLKLPVTAASILDINNLDKFIYHGIQARNKLLINFNCDSLIQKKLLNTHSAKKSFFRN